MVAANFEEKTFENAYNMELASGVGGTRRIFSPGQVLEKLTGFDVAADPGSDHLIWQIISVKRPPGLSLVPAHWVPSSSRNLKPEELPNFPVSLILQFKRPEYLHGSRAKQWKLWRSPYYRFIRTAGQHSVLRRLERNLGDVALVRYAAPAFHTLAELETAQLAGEIVMNTGHVSPEMLGRHQVWTYDKAGAYGRGNPHGPEILFETFADLFSAVVVGDPSRVGEVVRYQGLDEHLAVLAAACRLREPRVRAVVNEWMAGFAALPASRTPVEVRSILNFVTVQAAMSWYNLTWWIVDRLSVR